MTVTSGTTGGAGPAPPVLSARGISKSYGSRTALHATTVELWPGEVVAVIGPNGAGKTTLLSILAGATRATGGDIRSPSGSRAVGWVPQQTALYSRLTVAENLRLFAHLEHVRNPKAVVERMLEQAGLTERADELVGRLSGGNRQRINIAVGLLAGPRALLLDEPSSALDPRQRERLWQFVNDLAQQGTAVLFSTHNIKEAERHAGRVLVLADGELLFAGSASELAAEVGIGDPEQADLEDAFSELLARRGH